MRISRNATLLTALGLLLTLGGVCLYSFLSLRQAMGQLDLIMQEVLLVNEASEKTDQLVREVADSIIARDRASHAKVLGTVSAIQQLLETFGQGTQTAEASRSLESLRRMTRTCGDRSQRIFLLSQQGHIPEAVAVRDELARIVQFMKEELNSLLAGELTHYRGIRAELSERAARMAVLTVAATGAILLASFLLLGFTFGDELRKREQLNAELEQRVRARSQELEQAQRQLVDAAHLAGRAEVAVSVLHNVGNVLNSLNINASMSAESLKALRLDRVARTGELLAEHSQQPTWLSEDPRGKKVPRFLTELGLELEMQRAILVSQQQEMLEHVEHIKQVVAMQNAYASRRRLVEKVSLAELIELALRINQGSLSRHGVEVVRHFEPLPELHTEKHSVLQILVNLISNAQQALVAGRASNRRLTLQLGWGKPDFWRISVEDNGVGIASESLGKLFFFGFTTRKEGHGIGLHSCALSAQEMGGTLTAHSEGLGHGATFTLEVPVEREGPAPAPMA